MPVKYTMDQVSKAKNSTESEVPSDVETVILEGQAAEAYLAGYVAGSTGTDTIKEIPSSGGTVEPLRISIPWWP